jgi:hypothetical protein
MPSRRTVLVLGGATVIASSAVLNALIHDHKANHPATNVLLELDLSKMPLGPVTAAGAGLIFGKQNPIADDYQWRFSSIVADPDGRRWLRWFSKANTEGADFGVNLGIPLARRVDEATLDMVLRLSPGFDPAFGVKWPGPSMTTPGGTGTRAGSGNDPGDADASCRSMLIKPVTGTFPQPPPEPERRALSPFEVAEYGYQVGNIQQMRFTRFVPTPGVPFAQRKRIKLNSFAGAIPNADGALQTWYADEGTPLAPGRDDPAEKWRVRPDVRISHVFWSQHRGGPNGDPRWAAPNDGWVDIADGLTVTTPAPDRNVGTA